MQYLITFLEGLISFVSPCFLPMLPIYLAYFAGDAGSDEKGRTVRHSLIFMAGFTLVFVLLGVFAGAVGSFLSRQRTLVNIVSGILLVIFGLVFMDVIKLPFAVGTKLRGKPESAFSVFLFGMVFSVSLSPCVGAFLGSALVLASGSGTVLKGASLLFTYSLGLGVPLVLSAFLMDRLKNTFDFIKRHYRAITLGAGALLVIMGVLIAFGLADRLFASII